MAKGRMDLNEFVGKLLAEQDGDVLREGIRVLAQALMESEVAELLGAERHERTSERAGYRNGYRMQTWDTRVGTIELAIRRFVPGVFPVASRAPPARAGAAGRGARGVLPRGLDPEGGRPPQGPHRGAPVSISGSTRPTTKSGRTAGCRAWRPWWRSG